MFQISDFLETFLNKMRLINAGCHQQKKKTKKKTTTNFFFFKQLMKDLDIVYLMEAV